MIRALFLGLYFYHYSETPMLTVYSWRYLSFSTTHTHWKCLSFHTLAHWKYKKNKSLLYSSAFLRVLVNVLLIREDMSKRYLHWEKVFHRSQINNAGGRAGMPEKLNTETQETQHICEFHSQSKHLHGSCFHYILQSLKFISSF